MERFEDLKGRTLKAISGEVGDMEKLKRIQNKILWVYKYYALPTDREKKVLAYSPIYEGVDESMVFRIVSAQFVKICTDIEYWAYLEKPYNQSVQIDQGLQDAPGK